MAWFTKLARTSLPLGCSRTLTSSTKTTAAQLKILREAERERAAPATDGELNCDGPYSAPQMKTTMPGPKSRVSVYLWSIVNIVGSADAHCYCNVFLRKIFGYIYSAEMPSITQASCITEAL